MPDGTKRSLVLIVREMWIHMVLIVVYVLLVSYLDISLYPWLDQFKLPVAVVTIPGTVIGLLLAFRTNSCYQRWWEARILWGAIVNDSRSWVRQLLEFSRTASDDPAADPQIRLMAYRQIGWCYALARNLRGQDPAQDLHRVLDDDEISAAVETANVPNRLLQTQSENLRELYRNDRLELYQFVELERTLSNLTNWMGGCERIRNTPFPGSYSRLVGRMIYMFIILLPFGLVDVYPISLVIASLAIGISFLIIDRVAIHLQDPFSNRPTDTTMLALSRTIETNIRQMLGEQKWPEMPEPEPA